jgi:hypothetical protein
VIVLATIGGLGYSSALSYQASSLAFRLRSFFSSSGPSHTFVEEFEAIFQSVGLLALELCQVLTLFPFAHHVEIFWNMVYQLFGDRISSTEASLVFAQYRSPLDLFPICKLMSRTVIFEVLVVV